MAEETIILKTEVELGNSTNSVKSLKAELKAVTNELATLEEGSEAFVNAAKKAGALKDKIGDVKTTINAFNPEKKFQIKIEGLPLKIKKIHIEKLIVKLLKDEDSISFPLP